MAAGYIGRMTAATRHTALCFVSLAAFASAAGAQRTASPQPAPGFRSVYLDSSGVVRWRDNRDEVRLFGANYVIHTASDYRAAGYVRGDRKRMIDEDMAHFARMGWDGLRLTFWGDWQASDSAGNLIVNDHLDLLDYLIARARERGIYMLFSPIQTYSANWPNSMVNDARTPGFGRVFGRARLGTDPAAIAAQVNYLRQILNHVNPYTGVALKDEPAILFIELVNEPWHHPEDLPGSIRYINALTDAVRGTGCDRLIFYNVSQDFRIGEAIRRSRAQGVSFGWYPSALNSGFELSGNYLRSVDAFPDMLRPELARLPRIVYEFDSPDLTEATLYPAMTRTFRAVGAQLALMFSYDMLGTASRNLGWQTHYLNLVYTPRKAMSAVIAAEAMRRLPRLQDYGAYPGNTRFGDFRVSYEENLSELVARDAFMHAGTTRSTPPDPAALQQVYGLGSSPVVSYEGSGTYFLDRVRSGVWRLEVYPDAEPVRDPFEAPNAAKIVSRAIHRAWPMTVRLPDLGTSFSVWSMGAGGGPRAQARDGGFTVEPGVYVLSTAPVDPATLPRVLGSLGFAEYHAPRPDTAPDAVVPLAAPAYVAGQDAEIAARVVTAAPPDSVTQFVKPAIIEWFRAYRMRPAGDYRYAATVPAAAFREGPHEFVITVFRGDSLATWPGRVGRVPWSWDYYGRSAWTFDVVAPGAPLALFEPGRDAARLAFTRIGDAGRRGLFRVALSDVTGRPVMRLALPVDSSGWSPPDYTASLLIRDRVRARGQAMSGAEGVRIRLRGLGARQTLHVTLVEDDGTSWTAPVAVDSAWTETAVPLSAFTAGRSVLLPQGFPGQWNYWVGPAAGRGGSGDRPRVERIERLQLSLRREEGDAPRPDGYGVMVEAVTMTFGRGATVSAAGWCTATLRVRVPEGAGPVYLAGSLPELRPWRPNGRVLPGEGRERTVQVTAPPGTAIEYKFTLGSWEREAVTESGGTPGNHRLVLTRDTTVQHGIPGFKRDVREYIADWRGSGVLGRLVYWTDVPSWFLGPTRHVSVWLPPGYDSNTTRRYRVLYMSDGQNLHDPRLASTGTDWGVDEAVVRLVERGVMDPVIVVGVWSTAERGAEYSPWHRAPDYARFLIEELMPRVNAEFRTLTGPANTAHMGSSMGGLLSFYLVTHHPQVFGACGCMSTHFPLSSAVVRQFFPALAVGESGDTTPYVVRDIRAGLRAPRTARYWFDYSELGLDSAYAPTHEAVRDWLLRQGRVEGRDFSIRRYLGVTHNEASWRARLEDPLTFLFGAGAR